MIKKTVYFHKISFLAIFYSDPSII